MAVEISSCCTQKIRTFDLYACLLVRNEFQRCADLMRIKLGSRLKKGIRKFIQVVCFKQNPIERSAAADKFHGFVHVYNNIL